MKSLRLLMGFVFAVACGPGFAATGRKADAKADLVVSGKLEAQEYLGSLDELGMQGVIKARFRVTRVHSGRTASQLLTVRFIAHGTVSEDREFRWRLRETDDGTYIVCSDGGRGYICK
jgi:hypothetical protein